MIEHLQTILSFSVRQGNMTQLRDSEDWRFTLCGPFLWWQWKGPGRQLQRSGETTTAQIRTICILPSAFHVVYIAHTLSLSLCCSFSGILDIFTWLWRKLIIGKVWAWGDMSLGNRFSLFLAMFFDVVHAHDFDKSCYVYQTQWIVLLLCY